MQNRSFAGSPAWIAIAIAIAVPAAAWAPWSEEGAGFLVSGYWKGWKNASSDYERHIRVSGDSGFYCVLDGKSSFAFAIGPDSLTTPMNGKNGVAWMPGSGDLVISGYEKGVAYTERFSPSDSASYWDKCREEEGGGKTTAIRGGTDVGKAPIARPEGAGSRSPGFGWKRKVFSALGRFRRG